MWKILGPLIVLVLVLLFQIGRTENFATTSGSSSTDASGNSTDASGNTTSSSTSTTITLSLSDLLSLFKYSTPTTTSASTTSSETETPTKIESQTPQDFYTGIRSDLLSDVKGVVRSELVGSPYSPAAPLSCGAPCSDSAAQGVEYQNALQDYVKKDEIPCYGCSL
jgi:hypothetical protein